METSLQWRAVDVVAMEEQRRWKGLSIQRFGEWGSYSVTLHGLGTDCCHSLFAVCKEVRSTLDAALTHVKASKKSIL